MKRKAESGKRKAEMAAVAAMPDAAVSQSLARILRPQGAYRWILPQLSAITPQYIEAVLRGALAGNHVQQWELFDLMFDTWPELAACAQELADGVMERKMIFEPFCEEDEDTTPTAQERSKLVSAALRRMRPEACADENDMDGTLRDILDGWFRGVTCLEVDWQMTTSGVHGQFIAPRATFWVHPVCFAFDISGRLGLRTDAHGQMQPLNLAGTSLQPKPSVVGAFPPHKFLIGIHKAKSGTALGGGMLRPLAWWWCAANFSADWLLNLAQVFGLPFRWANYDPHAPQATVDAICNMLQNMGSAGWAAFPAGTTLELKEATKEGGDHSPQGELLDRADRYARLVILGQTMSGSQDSSKGGGKAFGAVESDVKERRINAAAKYACGILNTQLIPSILTLNYGDADEAPHVRLLEDDEGDLPAAQRDKTLADAGLEIPTSFLRKKYNIPAPSDGEEVIGGKEEKPETGNRKPETGEDAPLSSKAARIVGELLSLGDEEMMAALGAVAAGNGFDPSEPRDESGKWTKGSSTATISTSVGHKLTASRWFMNANKRFAVEVTTPANKIVIAEETAPGEFRDAFGKGLFKSTDATLEHLRADAREESEKLKAQREAAEAAKVGSVPDDAANKTPLTSWGSGRSFGFVKLNGVDVSETFLAQQLKSRGIEVATDWAAFNTKSARISPETISEIVDAWNKRPQDPVAPEKTQVWDPDKKGPSYV